MLMFDIETNGLLKEVNVLHCMSVYDTEKEKMYRFDPSNVEDGVKMLQDTITQGGKLCGHNVIDYDIPVLEKLYPHLFHISYEQQKQVVDTLVLARLIYSNIDTIDPVTRKACKKCGSNNVDYGTRVIGYLKRISNFSDARQKEVAKRYYAKPNLR